MEKCLHSVGRFDIVGYDIHSIPPGENLFRECLRPKDHQGPHLIRRPDWTYVVWEKDPCRYGTCEACDCDDPTMTCAVYAELTSAVELQKFLEDASFVGNNSGFNEKGRVKIDRIKGRIA